MPTMINPLRYPGAKRSLTNYIEALLQANHLEGCTFLEPYAGSAAVGLELLQRNRIDRLVLCEKDILIYAFWECVFRDTDILCETIENVDVSIDTWLALQRYREMTTLEEAPLPELAYAGLFFNRTNFSGILKANPIGGINRRRNIPSTAASTSRNSSGSSVTWPRITTALRSAAMTRCSS